MEKKRGAKSLKDEEIKEEEKEKPKIRLRGVFLMCS
jgi:hypothetical protein